MHASVPPPLRSPTGEGGSRLGGTSHLADQVAALAARHGFDWKVIGKIIHSVLLLPPRVRLGGNAGCASLKCMFPGEALHADPWECWKIYEDHQRKGEALGTCVPYRSILSLIIHLSAAIVWWWSRAIIT